MHLLKYFKALTVQPQNTKELKGLILQLAIEGKLTEEWRKNNLNIETASVLLKRIKSEKQKLIGEKKIKKGKPLPPITEEEIPYELPQGWVWCRLGEVTHNFGQKKPDRRFSYIDVGSIDNLNGVISGNVSIVDPLDAPSRARKIVKKGCVLYSTVRPYLLNIAIADREWEHEPIASTAFAVLNLLENCSPQYLHNFLRSRTFTNYVEDQMKGVAYPAINDQKLMRGLFALPPTSEQMVIAEITEQLIKEVEQLEKQTSQRLSLKKDYATSALRALTTGDTKSIWSNIKGNFKTFFDEEKNIKKLRGAVLELAVQGKLTANWRVENPNVESASVLLERIKEEKQKLIAEKKIRKDKPLPPIMIDEIPYELPEGWVWCRVGEISIHSLGKMLDQRKNKGFLKPYLRNKNVRWFSIDLSDLKEMRFEDHETEKYSVQKNDILICEGGYPGRAAIWDHSDSIMFQKALHRVRFIKQLTIPKYFLYFLALIDYNRDIEQYFTGAGIQHLTGKSLDRMLIPLPPYKEQQSIIKIINKLMDSCEMLNSEMRVRDDLSRDFLQSSIRDVIDKTHAVK